MRMCSLEHLGEMVKIIFAVKLQFLRLASSNNLTGFFFLQNFLSSDKKRDFHFYFFHCGGVKRSFQIFLVFLQLKTSLLLSVAVL